MEGENTTKKRQRKASAKVRNADNVAEQETAELRAHASTAKASSAQGQQPSTQPPIRPRPTVSASATSSQAPSPSRLSAISDVDSSSDEDPTEKGPATKKARHLPPSTNGKSTDASSSESEIEEIVVTKTLKDKGKDVAYFFGTPFIVHGKQRRACNICL
jgi:hypothetical protein